MVYVKIIIFSFTYPYADLNSNDEKDDILMEKQCLVVPTMEKKRIGINNGEHH